MISRVGRKETLKWNVQELQRGGGIQICKGKKRRLTTLLQGASYAFLKSIFEKKKKKRKGNVRAGSQVSFSFAVFPWKTISVSVIVRKWVSKLSVNFIHNHNTLGALIKITKKEEKKKKPEGDNERDGFARWFHQTFIPAKFLSSTSDTL